MKSSIKSYAVLSLVGALLIGGVVLSTREIMAHVANESSHSVISMVVDTQDTYRSMLEHNQAVLDAQEAKAKAKADAEAKAKAEAEAKAKAEAEAKENESTTGETPDATPNEPTAPGKADESKDAPDAGTAGEPSNPDDWITIQSDGSRTYLIRPGDTLCLISKRVGYSVDELTKLNAIKDVNLIYSGSVLRLPAAK